MDLELFQGLYLWPSHRLKLNYDRGCFKAMAVECFHNIWSGVDNTTSNLDEEKWSDCDVLTFSAVTV
jgi:hypothetical protein